MIARFRIRTADGVEHVGSVHGSGGRIASGRDAARRVRAAIASANDGTPLAVYEPAPGHVKFYPAAGRAGTSGGRDDPDAFVHLDLRGATLVKAWSVEL